MPTSNGSPLTMASLKAQARIFVVTSPRCLHFEFRDQFLKRIVAATTIKIVSSSCCARTACALTSMKVTIAIAESQRFMTLPFIKPVIEMGPITTIWRNLRPAKKHFRVPCPWLRRGRAFRTCREHGARVRHPFCGVRRKGGGFDQVPVTRDPHEQPTPFRVQMRLRLFDFSANSDPKIMSLTLTFTSKSGGWPAPRKRNAFSGTVSLALQGQGL